MLTKRGLKYCSEDSGMLESCTYIGSQNSPHIVLLLWPKIDRVTVATKVIILAGDTLVPENINIKAESHCFQSYLIGRRNS